MNKKQIVGFASGAAVFFIIVWLLWQNKNKDLTIGELLEQLEEQKQITEDVKQKLRELIENNPEIDPAVSNELKSIGELLEIKQENSAVLKMAKIIENLLKELYKKDPSLKESAREKGRKQPAFADYLEHAKTKGVISNEDYHLLSVLKIVRNEEAHELDVKKERTRLQAILISGLSIIMTLSALVKARIAASSQ